MQATSGIFVRYVIECCMLTAAGKCAAAALDVISTVFQDAILPTVFPVLEQMICSPEWERLESAILAIGAIAEGIHSPFLLNDILCPNFLI